MKKLNRNVPQGLKPSGYGGSGGTTKVVPFQNIKLGTGDYAVDHLADRDLDCAAVFESPLVLWPTLHEHGSAPRREKMAFSNQRLDSVGVSFRWGLRISLRIKHLNLKVFKNIELRLNRAGALKIGLSGGSSSGFEAMKFGVEKAVRMTADSGRVTPHSIGLDVRALVIHENSPATPPGIFWSEIPAVHRGKYWT